MAEAAEVRRSFVWALLATKGKVSAGMLRLVVEALNCDDIDLPAPKDVVWCLGHDAPRPSISR